MQTPAPAERTILKVMLSPCSAVASGTIAATPTTKVIAVMSANFFIVVLLRLLSGCAVVSVAGLAGERLLKGKYVGHNASSLAAPPTVALQFQQSHQVALLDRTANLGDVGRSVLKGSTRIRRNFPRTFQRQL